MSLDSRLKVLHSHDAGAVTGTDNGAVIDAAGFDEAIIILNVGVIAATGTLNVKVQEDDVVAFSSPADIAGAAFAEVLTAGDQTTKIGRVRLEGSRQGFIRVVATQAVAGADASVDVILLQAHRAADYVAPDFDV